MVVNLEEEQGDLIRVTCKRICPKISNLEKSDANLLLDLFIDSFLFLLFVTLSLLSVYVEKLGNAYDLSSEECKANYDKQPHV